METKKVRVCTNAVGSWIDAYLYKEFDVISETEEMYEIDLFDNASGTKTSFCEKGYFEVIN